MKKLIWVLIPLSALFFACEKTSFNTNPNNPDKKFGAVENGVKVPLKGSFKGMTTEITTECVPGHNFTKSMSISGAATQVGEIFSDKSWWTANTCVLDPATMMVTQAGDGVLAGDYGNSYFVHAVVQVNVVTKTFEGTIEITGGTGKFLNSTGECAMTNGVIYPDGSLTWSADGYVILAK